MHFHDRPDPTHLLFIDADIGLEPNRASGVCLSEDYAFCRPAIITQQILLSLPAPDAPEGGRFSQNPWISAPRRRAPSRCGGGTGIATLDPGRDAPFSTRKG